VQIGKALPTSCQASIPIEGPNSWPCYADGILTAAFKYLKNDSSYDEGLLENMMANIRYYTAIYLVCIVGTILVLRITVWWSSRRLLREFTDPDRAEKDGHW
jgi:hypothetical protein